MPWVSKLTGVFLSLFKRQKLEAISTTSFAITWSRRLKATSVPACRRRRPSLRRNA